MGVALVHHHPVLPRFLDSALLLQTPLTFSLKEHQGWIESQRVSQLFSQRDLAHLLA